MILRACAHSGNRCWPCMTNQCYDKPVIHEWMCDEDVEAFNLANQPFPEGKSKLCGCAFCGWPAISKEEIEKWEATLKKI